MTPGRVGAHSIPIFGVPIWGVAIAVAAVAPLCVRAAVDALARRTKERTDEVLASLKTDATKLKTESEAR